LMKEGEGIVRKYYEPEKGKKYEDYEVNHTAHNVALRFWSKRPIRGGNESSGAFYLPRGTHHRHKPSD